MGSGNRKSKKVCVLFLVLLCFHLFWSRILSADTNVGGTISTNTTWTLTGSPYIVTSNITVQAASNPVLTIQPGVIVKFNSGTNLTIANSTGGGLYAVGTATQPILFQANSASPTPGFWTGLRLNEKSAALVTIAFAQISHAGYAIIATKCSPVIHHVTLQSSSASGFRTQETSTPVFYENSFIGNGSGITHTVSAPTALYSWWNSASGPSGAGPGTGQSITSGVKYEPWLTAAHSNQHYFVYPFTHRNRTFNPNIGVNSHISFNTISSGNWTVTIKNSVNTTVKTFSGVGTSPTIDWDGKNDSGALQPNGTYTYQIESTAGANAATPATGKVILDTTLQLTISNLAVSQSFISPNGDAIQETTTLTGTISFDGGSWTVNVKNSSGTTIRTGSGSGSSVSFLWDGKNGSGVLQPEGIYTIELLVTDDAASTSGTKTVIIDTTLPTSVITSPVTNETISNVYEGGSTSQDIIGTANDTNFNNWKLQYGLGSSPGTYSDIATGSTAKVNTIIGSWQTVALNNGVYTIRLQVWDKAGNLKNTTVVVAIGHFKVSQNTYEFNGSTGGTVSYSSIVPFTLTETLFIKNAAGQTVRTLLNTQRTAGTYNDPWNGRNDSNAILPDGPYFHFATVTSGSYSMTWDITNEFLNDGNDTSTWVNIATSFDAFNNQPINYSFLLAKPYRATLLYAPIQNHHNDCVGHPTYSCVYEYKYLRSGTHTGTWAGTDNTGLFRPDLRFAHVAAMRDNFSKNAVVLFGTAPTISSVTVTPTVYRPLAGTQSVNFTFGTYQNQTANITITILNHQTLSEVRTVPSNGVPPGNISIPWDGKANNGTFVSPGFYTVTVSVTDSINQQITSQILTAIAY